MFHSSFMTFIISMFWCPQICIQSIDDFKWRDRLRDDVKHQSEELTTAQGRLRDIQTSLSESQVNEVLNCALTWCWNNTTSSLICSQVISSFLLPCQMLLQFLLFINLFRALFTIKKPLLPCCYLHVSCRSWHFVNLFLHYLVSSFLLSPSTGTCAALFSLLFLFYIVLHFASLFLLYCNLFCISFNLLYCSWTCISFYLTLYINLHFFFSSNLSQGLLLPVQFELSKVSREKDLLVVQNNELQASQVIICSIHYMLSY